MPLLSSLRVLEFAEGICGPYAGMLLADQGADVVKVEPSSGGDRARGSATFHVVNRGKRSVTLGVNGDRDTRLLEELVDWADVLILDNEGGRPYEDVLAYERIAALHPDKVWCAIPGFPESSRFRDLPGEEPLLAAASGLMGSQGAAERDGPVYLTLPLASYFTGMLAASGIMAALRVVERHGSGQRVVVPAVAVGAFIVGGIGVTSDRVPRADSRPSPWGGNPAYRLFHASDAWLVVACTNPDFFARLCVAVDRPELVSDPRFINAPWGVRPAENREALVEILSAIFATKTCDEWLDILREHDVPSAPVGTRAEYMRSELVRANGMAIEVVDPEVGRMLQMGVPLRLDGVRERPRAPAPRLGQDGAAVRALVRGAHRAPRSPRLPLSDHPLEGIRVLDFTAYLGGPLCGSLLAQLGAEVIKIEPLSGEGFRSGGLSSIGLNRGKRALAVDLKTAEGAAILRKLIARSDVVLEGFRPGAAERMGIDTASLHAINPRLIHCAITGYGDYEPFWPLPSFDPLFQARSGQMHGQGGSGFPPVFAGVAQNDFASAFLALFGILGLLWRRERTGAPGFAEVFQCDAALAIQAGESAEYEGRPPVIAGAPDLLGERATCRLFEAADHKWFLVDALHEGHCEQLFETLAIKPDPWIRQANLQPPDGQLARLLEERFKQAPAQQWVTTLTAAGVPAVPALIPQQDSMRTPILEEMGIVVGMDHRIFGHLTTIAAPLWFSHTKVRLGNPAPWVGEDNRPILSEIGFVDSDIDELVKRRVVSQLPDPPLA